ncbi:MAG TPA: TetR/AcrR family transcriptional regulator [Candidatus Ruania gallistercoris]|uniref:TetR/AcrR family transcriptional regulator n=1 Tax=Candidatus Ruania gallistercoris TaxID=2838746 RepID=A0A9D2EDU6_9MICO|nr:TetR/AcrR family transcriptional regulator [Candidatus Ruania gallistercoris]
MNSSTVVLMGVMADQGGARVRHKTATRLAIQTAAIELYEERGYEGTKVEDIVERAGVSQRSFFRYFPYKELTLFGDDYTQYLADLVRTAPEHLDAIETLNWAAGQLFAIPTTDLDRRRQAVRARLGDDARVQRQLAHLHESLGRRLRDAYIKRLGIDPDDTTDLRPQILVGLYLSLAVEITEGARPAQESRKLWEASLRRLL